VGLALSGGGFRASLFHIGVLARLAERDVLRHVEVLSTVSGGSIVGAAFYLRVRQLLQTKEDGTITADDYLAVVRQLGGTFLAGVAHDVRGNLLSGIRDDVRMLMTRYTRTERGAHLYDQVFYDKIEKEPGLTTGSGWRLPDLIVTPKGEEDGFSLL